MTDSSGNTALEGCGLDYITDLLSVTGKSSSTQLHQSYMLVSVEKR